MDRDDLYKQIPPLDEILESEEFESLNDEFGRSLVKSELRAYFDSLRTGIREETVNEEDLKDRFSRLAETVKNRVEERLVPSLREVINATGIIVHTNLGRAPLKSGITGRITDVISGYSNLEYDLAEGKRGYRGIHYRELLCRLTGAEDACVTNNNAAAVLLTLNTFARDKQVIVSRGEMIEIGGSFRIPEVIRKSGCILKEVGTTNKTKPSDYVDAISEKTGAILKVHPSNYTIEGFTREATGKEIAQIGEEYNIPVVYDLGSGNLIDLPNIKEPSVSEKLKLGLDVVSFSGDKLLGGPQAGIIVGKTEHLDKIKKNPLSRALRVGKFTIAALYETLTDFLREDVENIPALSMIFESKEKIKKRSKQLAARAEKILPNFNLNIQEGNSRIGGGAAPGIDIPTFVITLSHPEKSSEDINGKLRKSDPPVISRIKENKVLIDLRTVFPRQEDAVIDALKSLEEI